MSGEPQRMSGARKATGPVALVAVVVIALGVATAVSRQFFERPVREPPPPRDPGVGAPAGPADFRVAAIEGPIEALHGGQWYVVQAGDFLNRQDVIRTPRGSRALLRRGATEIEVRENVDIRLDSLAEKTASFGVLRGGNVVASVGAAGEKVAITAQEARAENRGPARWVVSLAPGGQVNVAASRGDVTFSARGKDVVVGAGMESSARPGQPPSAPERIPEELMLSVVWPEVDHATAEAHVAGTVSASSRVRVNGVEAEVAPDGHFSAPVSLSVGANKIAVEAEDITGRKKTDAKVVRRAPRAPTLVPADEDLWKRK